MNFSWPINPTTVNAGPVQFVLDGVNVEVTEDTVTPADSFPLPVKVLDGSGTEVDFATEAKQDAQIVQLAAIELATEATQTAVESIDVKVATQAKQDTQITHLSAIELATEAAEIAVESIDAKVATEAKQDTQITRLLAIETATEATQAAVESIGNKVSTEAKQDTQITHLSAIETATEAVQVSAASIDSKVLTDAQLRASPVPVSGPLTDTQLRASAVPVSAASLPLPTGAATEATLSTLNAKVTAVDTGAVVIAASALPTGAATEATLAAQAPLLGAVTETAPASDTASSGLNGRLQRIAQRLTSLIALFPTSLGTKTSANSLAVVLASDQASLPTVEAGFVRANAPVRNDYSSVNVTTAAYTQLVASTSAAIKQLQIFDSSGQTIAIATGPAASEVDQFYIPPGGAVVNLTIAASTRVSIKAVTANATSGYIVVNFLG